MFSSQHTCWTAHQWYYIFTKLSTNQMRCIKMFNEVTHCNWKMNLFLNTIDFNVKKIPIAFLRQFFFFFQKPIELINCKHFLDEINIYRQKGIHWVINGMPMRNRLTIRNCISTNIHFETWNPIKQQKKTHWARALQMPFIKWQILHSHPDPDHSMDNVFVHWPSPSR